MICAQLPLWLGFRNSDPIPLWTWDAAKTNVQKTPVTKGQAEEYYAVRAVKWALENSPNDPAVVELGVRALRTVAFAMPAVISQ